MSRLSLIRPAEGVAVVLRAANPNDDVRALAPSERALVHALPPGRQRDFAAGRRAAGEAIRALGRSGPVLRDGARPRFPSGVMGAISHCRGEVAAGAASVSPAVAGVGVDVERLGRLSPHAAQLVCTQREFADLADLAGGGGSGGASALTAAFSVKEAFYKAVSGLGLIRRPVHHDVELSLTGGDARIEVAEGLLPPGHEALAQVRFEGPYVWTLVLVLRRS